MDLLFFVFFILDSFSLVALLYRIGVVTMIDLDTSLAEYLYRGTTSAIEELTIMRDDDISSFPGMLEIVLEPLD